MFVERKIREELNALSKEVFGVSSKWMSLLEHGEVVPVTETITETIPGENGQPDRTETAQVPKLNKGGSRDYTVKRYTVDEVKEKLLALKKNRDELIAKIKAAQAQKELEKKVQDEAKGRVVV
jgi:hypothetical protein